MDKATFPLNEKMRGAKVGILHAALAALGLAVPEAERSRQYFGAATKAAVVEFQKKHRLKPTGAVDEATAAAFNAAPGETATALTAAAAQARAASGRVLRAGLPVKGARVRAFQETEGGAVRLGEDITDAEGRYTIRYDSLPGVTAVNLRVAVEDEEGRPVGEPKVIAGAQALEIVDLIAPAAGKPAKQPVLKGNIITENGLPLPKGTRVGVYRRDFGGKGRNWRPRFL
jgi:peptidoglycan hydrolase-like protein with peptidoglycan-binding domain